MKHFVFRSDNAELYPSAPKIEKFIVAEGISPHEADREIFIPSAGEKITLQRIFHKKFYIFVPVDRSVPDMPVRGNLGPIRRTPTTIV